MKCDQARLYLSDLADDRATGWTRQRLRRHLRGCAACTGELQAIRQVSRQLRQCAATGPAPDFRERLRAAAPPPAPEWLTEQLAAGRSEQKRNVPLARRGLFALAASAGLAVLALALSPRPVSALQATLDAMASVESAYATGTHTRWSERDPQGRPLPKRFQVEHWYQAPDRYRRNLRSGPAGSGGVPNDYVVNGSRAVFIERLAAGGVAVQPTDAGRLKSLLSSFTFFDAGAAARLVHSAGAQVTQGEETTSTGTRRLIRIVHDQVVRRWRWELAINPETHRIERCYWSEETRELEGWQLRVEVTLDAFQYNIPLAPDHFEIPAAGAHPAPPRG